MFKLHEERENDEKDGTKPPPQDPPEGPGGE